MDGIIYLGLLDDEMIDLDVSALQLSALDHPGLELQPYHAILGGLWMRVREIAGSQQDAIEQARVLASVIGEEHGFTGDRESYDAPVNADMIRVIDRRAGLPVALAILYVATARRLGWNAAALNTPGHVLVRIGNEARSVLIDPFAGGGLVAREQLKIIAATGAGSAMRVRPMTNREVLVRLLLNQAGRAEEARDVARAALMYERMTIVAPAHGQGWWDLSRLQLALGKPEEARASLVSMLEVTFEPDRRQSIGQALETVGAMLDPSSRH